MEQIMEIGNVYDSDSCASTYSNFAEDDPNKKYKCAYENCRKAFYRPSKLENHMRVHTGEKPFKCEIADCDKCYHRKDLLKKHQEQSHFRNIKYVECEICQLKMRQNSLRKHILRRHNSFRKYLFQCEECGSGFRNQNELTNHMNQHSVIFSCPVCNKEFDKGYKFRKHVRSHKEYECICTEKFYDHNVFRTHKKNCEFAKRSCGICSQKFANNGNFKEHLKLIHGIGDGTMEIFACTFEGCTKKYNRKRNYKLHVANCHSRKDGKETRLVCSVCSLLLKNKVTLWRHMKNMHMNEKKVEKPRRSRRDKNKPKVPMLTVLTGIKHSEEKNDESKDKNDESEEKIDEFEEKNDESEKNSDDSEVNNDESEEDNDESEKNNDESEEDNNESEEKNDEPEENIKTEEPVSITVKEEPKDFDSSVDEDPLD